MAFILRNILYVNENEMKIGLETTLSFLWKVPSSDFPLVCKALCWKIIPSQDDRVILKPETLNRFSLLLSMTSLDLSLNFSLSKGYVVLNPEVASHLWLPDIIIDKVIFLRTIIIVTFCVEVKMFITCITVL